MGIVFKVDNLPESLRGLFVADGCERIPGDL
jgi:hypothetical protein